MKIHTLSFAVLVGLALTACGQTGTDPAVTTAPASASTADAPADPSTQPAGVPADSVDTAVATQAYQQDTAEPADKIAAPTDATADAALAHCATLDSAQRDSCELQARQGLDVQQSGVLDPASDPAQTPPTDRVPVDATAAQDDEDDDY